jgi:hypothetical protein
MSKMIELTLESDKKINRLIPMLVKENKDYSKEIKSRIKINSIFNKIDKKANSELSTFINDSNKRYANAKFGHDIENFIKSYENKNEERFNKIMNDKFFTDLDLKSEKEKMKHKSTDKMNTNIKFLISSLKTNLTTGTIGKSSINANGDLKKRRLNKFNKCYTENELSENKRTINEKALFENKNKNYISKIFDNDNYRINNSIDKYKFNLRKIKIPPLVPINNEPNENKKLEINFPQIKMLYYKKYIKQKTKEKKVEKVDLYKLLPYYYEGKNFKKQNSEKKITTKPENAPYFLTETINANHNNKNDYQNTNGLVANLVQNSMRLKSYMFRKNRMKDLLEHKIPNLEEYDRILMNKFQKIKEMRHKKSRELNEKQNINYLSKKQLLNYKVEKSIEMLGEKEKEYSGNFKNI